METVPKPRPSKRDNDEYKWEKMDISFYCEGRGHSFEVFEERSKFYFEYVYYYY